MSKKVKNEKAKLNEPLIAEPQISPDDELVKLVLQYKTIVPSEFLDRYNTIIDYEFQRIDQNDLSQFHRQITKAHEKKGCCSVPLIPQIFTEACEAFIQQLVADNFELRMRDGVYTIDSYVNRGQSGKNKQMPSKPMRTALEILTELETMIDRKDKLEPLLEEAKSIEDQMDEIRAEIRTWNALSLTKDKIEFRISEIQMNLKNRHSKQLDQCLEKLEQAKTGLRQTVVQYQYLEVKQKEKVLDAMKGKKQGLIYKKELRKEREKVDVNRELERRKLQREYDAIRRKIHHRSELLDKIQEASFIM